MGVRDANQEGKVINIIHHQKTKSTTKTKRPALFCEIRFKITKSSEEYTQVTKLVKSELFEVLKDQEKTSKQSRLGVKQNT